MTFSPPPGLHWDHFLSCVSVFIEIRRFVEIALSLGRELNFEGHGHCKQLYQQHLFSFHVLERPANLSRNHSWTASINFWSILTLNSIHQNCKQIVQKHVHQICPAHVHFGEGPGQKVEKPIIAFPLKYSIVFKRRFFLKKKEFTF